MHEKVNKDVLDRLSRMEGHIRSIKEMVVQERPCPDILIQIAAVRAALNQAGRIIMEDHIENCVSKSIKEGKEDKAILDLKDALKKFL